MDLGLALNRRVATELAPSLAAHVAIQEIITQPTQATVIVLGVTQSLARPHMVAFNRSNRFWRRSDVGKYQPDIAELRAMFLESQSWLAESEAFRSPRIDRILVQGAVPSLNVGSSMFVQVLPLGRLTTLISLASIKGQLRTELPPPTSAGYSHRFNTDGFLTYTAPAGN
jgi:hypothetical protein